jgi:hypothetical protein
MCECHGPNRRDLLMSEAALAAASDGRPLSLRARRTSVLGRSTEPIHATLGIETGCLTSFGANAAKRRHRLLCSDR